MLGTCLVPTGYNYNHFQTSERKVSDIRDVTSNGHAKQSGPPGGGMHAKFNGRS